MEHGQLYFFLLLGLYHGINPGMGWLFSVSIAMQKESTSKIFISHIPIALGHLASLAVTIFIYYLISDYVSQKTTKIIFGLALIGFGAYKLLKKGHFNWVKMNVTNFDLFLWSFLMASSHGAGLMLIPGFNYEGDHLIHHLEHFGFIALVFHTLAMLIVSMILAFTVYKVIGLRILRSSWINFDYIWSFVLIIGGIFIFFF